MSGYTYINTTDLNKHTHTQGRQAAASVLDYDVRCLFEDESLLTKMDERRIELRHDKRGLKVSLVFYGRSQGSSSPITPDLSTF